MGIKVTSEICNAVRTKLVSRTPPTVIEVVQAFAKIAVCKNCKLCTELEIKLDGYYGTCSHTGFAVDAGQLCEHFRYKPEEKKARRK